MSHIERAKCHISISAGVTAPAAGWDITEKHNPGAARRQHAQQFKENMQNNGCT